ncbi:MAG TPA: hypothetical protein VKP65_13320 [Rhodothermales bacterium]|nr:hypothetical protein [Rhodothermales bacterium]
MNKKEASLRKEARFSWPGYHTTPDTLQPLTSSARAFWCLSAWEPFFSYQP